MAPENNPSQSGTAAWVAIAVAIIGVVGTYIGSSGSTQQKELEIKRDNIHIEQEREKLAEERKDRYMEEIRIHESNLKSMSSIPHWRLVFENGCTDPIRLAVEYQALDAETVVEGWWTYEPGEKAYLADTDKRDYMFYAEDDKQHTWKGPQLLRASRSGPFFYIINHEFEAGWYPLSNETNLDLNKATLIEKIMAMRS